MDRGNARAMGWQNAIMNQTPSKGQADRRGTSVATRTRSRAKPVTVGGLYGRKATKVKPAGKAKTVRAAGGVSTPAQRAAIIARNTAARGPKNVGNAISLARNKGQQGAANRGYPKSPPPGKSPRDYQDPGAPPNPLWERPKANVLQRTRNLLNAKNAGQADRGNIKKGPRPLPAEPVFRPQPPFTPLGTPPTPKEYFAKSVTGQFPTGTSPTSLHPGETPRQAQSRMRVAAGLPPLNSAADVKAFQSSGSAAPNGYKPKRSPDTSTTQPIGKTVYAAKGVRAAKGMKPGQGGRFAKLKADLADKPGVTDPGALAASIGRKKFGPAKFQKMAAKGRK